MKYIKIEKNEEVSLIGQGCATLGENSLTNYEENIRTGIDCGLTLIDTAEVYGNGESERIVGRAIRGIRDKVFVCTKVSPENLSFKKMLDSAENSLKRLDCDIIDLYQIHWPNNNIDINQVIEAFEFLYENKKVRFFGVSNFYPMDFDKINTRILKFGKFISNQIEYNLFDRSAENGIITYFENLGIKIISHSSLNRGNIGDNILDGLSRKYNRTVYQISLNWIASRNIISIPSSSNVKHIIDNSHSCDFEIEKDDLDLITNQVMAKISYINVFNIDMADQGFGNHKIYYTEKEALDNKYNFCPSPKDMANFLLSLNSYQLNLIKPVRVIDDSDKLNLYEGRIRYWGWRIAFGDTVPIPVYIIKRGK